jgi:hypothetical protein
MGTFVLKVAVIVFLSHGVLELCATSLTVNMGSMVLKAACDPPSDSGSWLTAITVRGIPTMMSAFVASTNTFGPGWAMQDAGRFVTVKEIL